ncbi:BAAT/acyl-CoA thioester hydrolase carboxy-terminal protein (macronuclear) [Tetrahymena thermophila SB210]|uniref:BAAT/acyl-CoA thioester hydrolase carboxy-terminal protein n=1 Tax=Tetrahymena thermophila (strain SB210) TaxID=312017 RepID=I7MDD7_TETTS|nr:BAAT/acyl-CoA thioester hydrolase carboxy-terminal protein [Tetrahymena thermophila SB210]EAR87389.1 BAAT/acyl-CoA thioester hydrolase carboxy-terminal protein [Tetrahymena thermophila SB210]|eukprot:XP_001007634.1 BAAT/acyl-CoA thioester hydrolase carboxy-terminal protein [Tetrahymena thermophila SB210]
MDNQKQKTTNKSSFIVIYLHGFKSSGYSPKTELLKQEFANFISPSLPISPFLACDTIDQLIQNFKQFYQQIILIGSSLGGFYALSFLNKYPDLIKVILINPSVHCEQALSKHCGMHVDFRNFKFEWNQTHVEELEKIKANQIDIELQKRNILLLIQKGDKVIDYKETLQFLPQAQLDIEEGGTHQYENIQNKFQIMNQFIQS